MSIRPDADTYFFVNHREQREIAVKFDEAFDVSFARMHGDLYYWLLDPKQTTRERFGFSKEILVVYCSRSRVDQRSFRVADELQKDPIIRDRFEKGIIVLIHNSDKAQVESAIGSQGDLIVVPFLQSEFNIPQNGSVFIRCRFSEVLGSVDLFGLSSPIRDDRHFFGRSSFVQRLIGHCIQNGQNAGVFGLRKTGKTSVLFAFQRRIESSAVSGIFIDCQNPGLHSMRWWELLAYIAKQCSKSSSSRQAEEIKYEQNTAGMSFLNHINNIFNIDKDRKLVVMLDEIEYVSSGMGSALGKHWAQDFSPFWQTIRATHQETRGRLVFVVAGVNPAAVEQSHFEGIPNPIFQLASPFFIEPMSTDSIRQMVRDIGKRAGISFDDPVYSYLANSYGGHPYLIRIACSVISERVNRKDPERLARVTAELFSKYAQDIRIRIERPIKDILLSLIWWYRDEYEILQMLASGEVEFAKDYMQHNPEAILRFAKYGLLKEGTSSFAIQDVKEFLLREGEQYKKDVAKFKSSDIPPDKLPAIPDLARIGRLAEKRASIETILRKATLTYLGVKCGWNNDKVAHAIVKTLPKIPGREQPSEIFIGRLPKDAVNELYLLDLASIVKGNWDVFGPLFMSDKSRFEDHMNTINEIRLEEAHSNALTEADESRFMQAYDWIIKFLNRIPVDA